MRGLPSVSVVFQGGPVFENSYGGAGTMISLALGGRGSYFTMGLRINAGARWDDGDNKWEAGLEFGYRYMKRRSSGLTPHFSITLGYNHLWQEDAQFNIMYDWHIPVLRIGGGLMWGGSGRFGIGFEISYLGGYAFHANADENPWGQVYDWQYNAGTFHVIMTF